MSDTDQAGSDTGSPDQQPPRVPARTKLTISERMNKNYKGIPGHHYAIWIGGVVLAFLIVGGALWLYHRYTAPRSPEVPPYINAWFERCRPSHYYDCRPDVVFLKNGMIFVVDGGPLPEHLLENSVANQLTDVDQIVPWDPTSPQPYVNAIGRVYGLPLPAPPAEQPAQVEPTPTQ